LTIQNACQIENVSAKSSALAPKSVVKSGVMSTLPLILGNMSILANSALDFCATCETNALALNLSVEWLKGKFLKKFKVVVLPPAGAPCKTTAKGATFFMSKTAMVDAGGVRKNAGEKSS